MSMSKTWPEVPIHIVAQPAERLETPVSGKTYRQIGVRLWGQGAYERESIDGSETKYKTFNLVKAGDIIVNKIWARNGSVSVVSNELEGCYCSGEFPIFEPILTKIEPKWFYWITKTHWFWDQCDIQSRGTSGKNRIRPEKFIQIKIPLPSLTEQQRIVAKIERLARKIEEAKRIKDTATSEIEMLWRSELNNSFSSSSSNQKMLQDICEEIIDNLHSTPKYTGDSYPCIRSQDVGWGSINYMSALRTDEAEYIERTRRGAPKLGDIVYVREGDIGRCGLVDGTQQFSLGQRVMMLRPDKKKIIPKYLMLQLMSPSVLDNQIRKAKTGTTSHHINIKHLKTVSIIVPSLEKQRQKITHLEHIQEKLEKLKITRAQTTAELNAMLPSILDKAFKGKL